MIVLFFLNKKKKLIFYKIRKISLFCLLFKLNKEKMKLIIAEKPSVGRDLAAFLKCTEDKKGYFEGNGYAVTWAFGHLVSLANPEDYGWKDWTTENIPFMPERFKFVINESSKTQFNVISNLVKSCNEIIVATDAGREGELIFRLIYQQIGVKKPFKRLWLSSLTTEAISTAFQNMKDGSAYDSLYHSAITRAESDWLIGMNLTRMITLSAGDRKKVVSIGRVQTPTLAIICNRFLENKNFVKEPFYTPVLKLNHSSISFLAKFEKNFKTADLAKNILQTIQPQIVCSKVSRTKKIEKSPTLFDLTTLQRVAEKKFGYSAASTLEYAQKLYEMKVTTYPRTDSSYLSQDMVSTAKNVIEAVASQAIFPIQDPSHFEKIKMLDIEDNKVFDNSKVTDHHAIIPTGKFQTLTEKGLKDVYLLILERFLQCFYTDCHKNVTKYEFAVSEGVFSSTGIQIAEIGWRAFEIFEDTKDESDEQEDNQKLPIVEEGNYCSVVEKSVKESFTTPPPIHTESSLLGVMENPTKVIEDKVLLKGMKDLGLGTPATRHTIIEVLLKREYVKKIGRKLIPTDFGLSVYSFVKDFDFSKADLTATWEAKLNQMARGDYSREDFRKEIFRFLSHNVETIKNANTKIDSTDHSIVKIPCPKCKTGTMVERESFYGCSEFKNKTCDFSIFKTMFQKKISKAQLEKLMLKGKTDLIQGLVAKSGNTFEAHLKISDDFKIGLEFSNKKK